MPAATAGPVRQSRRHSSALAARGQCPCNVCRVWHADEDERLVALVGSRPLPEVTALLNTEFAHLRPPRTPAAVQSRANHLGLWTEYTAGFTLQQLGRLVSWDARQIRKHWIVPGLLQATRVRGRGRAGRWLVTEQALMRFLEAYPWAYDWRRFAPGPWRQRGQVIACRSPWRTVEDLLAYLGVRWRNVWEHRWRQIPHVRRHHSLGGANHSLGTPLVHQDVFPTIRQSLDLGRCTRRGGPPGNGLPHPEPALSADESCWQEVASMSCESLTGPLEVTGFRSPAPVPARSPIALATPRCCSLDPPAPIVCGTAGENNG